MEMRSKIVIVGVIILLLLAVCVGLLPQYVFSEEGLPKRELLAFMEIPVVVTTAKTELPITKSPSTVTVITAEEIQRSGATNIPDLLRMVPGLDIATVTTADTSVSIRGKTRIVSNQTLVLIDGRTVYLDFYGITLWPALPVTLDEIKQIEIVRGPGSVLWGANAYSGIINIITKSPEELKGAHLSLTGGNFCTSVNQFIHADVKDKIGYKISLGLDHTNYWEKDRRDKKAIDFTKFDGLFRYKLNDETNILFSGGHSDGKTDLFADIMFRRLSADAKSSYLKFIFKRSDFSAQFFHNFGRASGISEYAGNLYAFFKYRTTDFEFKHTLNWIDVNTLIWGVNARYNTIKSPNITKRHNQHLYGIYIQNEYKPQDNLSVFLGIRFDRHPLVKDPLSPRLSIVYAPQRDHTFRFSAATAFRTPTFLESYGDVNFTLPTGFPPPFHLASVRFLGNKDLKSESITSFELSYQTCLFDRLKGSLNIFYNKLENQIRCTQKIIRPFPLAYQFDTINQTEDSFVFGGETGIEVLINDQTTGFLNYSYQNVRCPHAHSHAPKHKINAGLRFTFDNGLNCDLNAYHVSGFLWKIGEVNSYTIANARIGRKFLNDDMEVALAIHNLFNNHHKEYPLGEEVGRKIMFRLSYKF